MKNQKSFKSGGMTAAQKLRLSLLGIVLLALAAAAYAHPQSVNGIIGFVNAKLGSAIPQMQPKDFRLGLDLQGGTHLVYEADVAGIPASQRTEALAGVRDIVERRVNAIGVAEPLVQTTSSGDASRVIVELPGVRNVQDAIKLIGETPFLEFREENTEKRPLNAQEKIELEKRNADERAKANEILRDVLKSPATFAEVARSKSDDGATSPEGGDMGFITNEGFYAPLYAAASKTAVGKIYGSVVSDDQGYSIIRTDARQDETEIKANHLLICWKGADRCDRETTKEDAYKKIQELKGQATASNFVDLVKKNSTEPGAESTGGNLGGEFFGRGIMAKPFEDAAFALKKGGISDIVETQFGYHLIYKTDERTVPTYRVSRILVQKSTDTDIVPQEDFKYTGLTGKHLKRASVQFNPQTNEPQITLQFNDEGAKLFADITARSVGKVVAILLDGSPISTPRVNEPIRDGQAVISGQFSIEEAKTLAKRLNTGALPVPIKLVSQETIGATLGQQSVTDSIRAALYGFLLVAIFMIILYRLPGLVAVIALAVYAALALAFFKLIGVTLTLAGIAGFILSIGIAVDANILVFERFREEIVAGKSFIAALEDGFSRAWPSIRDGNYSTLITCFVLIYFGTSTIKGFGITLALGIAMSLFSSMVVTRVILSIIARSGVADRLYWLFLRPAAPTNE